MSGVIHPTGIEQIRLYKTGIGGFYSGGPGQFQKDYILVSPNSMCTTSTNTITNYTGVDAIEVAGGASGQRYAFAATYDDGCIFSTLSAAGVPLQTSVYQFPFATMAINKPTIVQSPNSQSDFFITGKFDTTMYAMSVNINGSINWSSFYHVGGGMIEPRDMIISGHNGQLIIVGHCSLPPSYNQTSDAFLMSLDPSTGSVNFFQDYNSTPCQWFNTVKTAYSPQGSVGYVVGGWCDPSIPIYGTSLIMKLDLLGNIVWNDILTSGVPSFVTGEIFDVVERQNTTSAFEYYGIG
jgi:hypothetical protein